ncbi:hypothetical protein ACFLUV_00720 [Elusimicrobiota bacterium]
MNKKNNKLLQLLIFGIAMGFLEAAVVVYLREIFYPAGFSFPLNVISPQVLLIEQLREITTIIMLVVLAGFSGRNFYERLVSFLYLFGIWDIFYYVFLKVTLNWPGSLVTWDILFLIPVTWIGPVLAPVICSVTMIFLALLIDNLQRKKHDLKIERKEWILMVSGASIIFVTFIYDFSRIILEKGQEFMEAVSLFVPVRYNWWLFAAGEIIIISGIYIFYRRVTLEISKDINV